MEGFEPKRIRKRVYSIGLNRDGIACGSVTGAFTEARKIRGNYPKMGCEIFTKPGPVIFVCTESMKKQNHITLPPFQILNVESFNSDVILLKTGNTSFCFEQKFERCTREYIVNSDDHQERY
jgi:hypothetical protein